MISSVNSSRYNNNVFRDFTYNHDENFFITKPQDSEPSKKTSHKGRNIVLPICTIALLAGTGILVLSRGLPKNTSKYLERIKEYLGEKSEKAISKGSDKWNEFYISLIRQINIFMEKAQSINNWTSLKDASFKNLMYKNQTTRKIHKGISDFFEKISRRTVISSYEKTGKKFNKVFKSFEELDNDLLKENPDEKITIDNITLSKQDWIKKAKEFRNKIKTDVNNFISKSEQENRYKTIKSMTSELYGKFWEEISKGFRSKDNILLNKKFYQEFIAQQKIKDQQIALADQVAKVRKKITYSDKDKLNLIERQVKKLEELISPSDSEGLKLIKELKWYLKNPNGIGEQTGNFKKVLEKVTKIQFRGAHGREENLLNSSVTAIKDLLEDTDQGDLEKMLKIYERISSYKLSSLRPQVAKAIKSFDKSLNLETVEFVDKVRDLVLGSAPTDILSIVTSIGLIAYGLTQAEDTDERISVALKAGIPIVGAIGIAVLCTTNLISGSKSMLIAVLSGLLLNKIGTGTDTLRQKYSRNPASSQLA